jgi:hypothetical protein
MSPLFAYVEISLAAATIVTTMAVFEASDPSAKFVLALTDAVVIAGDILIAYAHFQVTHWVVTGELIRSAEDLRDWRQRP